MTLRFTVDDLSIGRGGRLLVDRISLTLGSGEALMLTGPNGSGKTSLLKCLAGIPDVHPSVKKSNPFTHAYVGHLNALKCDLTVRENLERFYPKASVHVADVDIMVDHQIRHLSAGQRRQVALARLPLSAAPLWLIDEPTTHLDDEAKARFYKTLQKHVSRGGMAILSSHERVPIPNIKVIALGS